MKKIAGSLYAVVKPGSIDWKLLIFLLLFLNVKLVIKAVVVLLFFIVRPDFKFGFRLTNSRLPLFYPLVIGIAVLNALISGLLLNPRYDIVLLTGIFFWVLCIMAIHQVKLAVEKNDSDTVHRTFLAFFILNAIVSLAVYAGIIWETDTLNPYQYQGNYQKYFIGTGDYIKGITLDTSTTNAVINAFAVVYFICRGKHGWALTGMGVLLLTGSNVTNLLIAAVLLFLFVFRSNRDQKSVIVVCLLFILVFLVKVSPQNSTYINTAVDKFLHREVPEPRQEKVLPITLRPDSTLSEEERKQKFAQHAIDSMYLAMLDSRPASPVPEQNPGTTTSFKEKPLIPEPNIHTPPFQHREDTTAFQQKLISFIITDSLQGKAVAENTSSKPGKLIAMKQIATYFSHHPYKLLIGAGMGMFSSKLAFKATALKIAGGYPERFSFINKDFEENHLALYLAYFTKSSRGHSIINTPNSTYGQLFSEYGLAGLAVFIFFYLGFFARNIKQLTYGLPLLLLMGGFFFIDYWFEQLSITILFELLLFLDMKENNKTPAV